MAIANFKKVAACSVRYFFPGTIWFPVTTRYYQSLPLRLRTAAESVPGKRYKSELKAAPGNGSRCVFGAGHKRAGSEARAGFAASVLAEEFSGFLVNEMKPGAGETDDGHIGIGTGLVLRRGRRKPMLYVRAQPWTSEKDMSAHHTGNMQKLAWPVTSVWLRSWRVSAGEKAGGGVPQGCWRIVPDSDQSRRGLKRATGQTQRRRTSSRAVAADREKRIGDSRGRQPRRPC